MKVSAIAALGFIATGVIAGDYDPKCKQVIYDPPVCKNYPRDVLDLEERDLDIEERDLELEERDDIAERDYGYPPNICKKKCPKEKLYCTKTDWAKGYPDYEGSFTYKVDCRKGKDYTVTGKIQNCGKGKSQCLVVTYNSYGWPKGHEKSYLGVYDKKPSGIKKYEDLNSNGYCSGNTCSIPVEKLPGYPKLCGDDLWIGIDAGRCESDSYGGYGGYGKKTPQPKDVIEFVKLHIECTGKKECKSYCCKI